MDHEEIKREIEKLKNERAPLLRALKKLNEKFGELEQKKKNTEKFLREHCNQNLVEIRKRRFSFPWNYYGGGDSKKRTYHGDSEIAFVSKEEIIRITDNFTNFESVGYGEGYVIEIVS